jgi:hypothetical protein
MIAADQLDHGSVGPQHWHNSLARTSARSNELILAGQYHASGLHEGLRRGQEEPRKALRSSEGAVLQGWGRQRWRTWWQGIAGTAHWRSMPATTGLRPLSWRASLMRCRCALSWALAAPTASSSTRLMALQARATPTRSVPAPALCTLCSGSALSDLTRHDGPSGRFAFCTTRRLSHNHCECRWG